jgi:periplasmic nitrate reductase NapD
LNISSIIVHPGPGQAKAVGARLAELDGVEIHAVAEDGRMIVTVEADGDGAMVNAFDAISKVEGVLSASMVYHQTESDPDVEISVEA